MIIINLIYFYDFPHLLNQGCFDFILCAFCKMEYVSFSTFLSHWNILHCTKISKWERNITTETTQVPTFQSWGTSSPGVWHQFWHLGKNIFRHSSFGTQTKLASRDFKFLAIVNQKPFEHYWCKRKYTFFMWKNLCNETAMVVQWLRERVKFK